MLDDKVKQFSQLPDFRIYLFKPLKLFNNRLRDGLIAFSKQFKAPFGAFLILLFLIHQS